jgi:hypothetical protein
MKRNRIARLTAFILLMQPTVWAEVPVISDVDAQPLSANLERVVRTLEIIGQPLDEATKGAIQEAIKAGDVIAMQKAIDSHVFVNVHLNPEVRVKASRGPAPARIRQHGYTPLIVKVSNESSVARALNVSSPQGGAVFSGVQALTLARMASEKLGENLPEKLTNDKFLDISVHTDRPMTDSLSGLEVEYLILNALSTESGKREATLVFDMGEGTKDLAGRAELPVLFSIERAVPVTIRVRDEDGQPTTARLEIRDEQGRIFPTQVKRLAPDLFFQPQIYRADGQKVMLSPGTYQVRVSRGPEYHLQGHVLQVPDSPEATWSFELSRWVNMEEYGYYSGDHHIHAAGCSHYEKPTEGVKPEDIFPQVKGEGLNVGCILTWGPCFDFQRNFFKPKANKLSEPKTIIKYDLEISGFGSAALGHVCLLNLKDQTYPGSDGTKEKGWPTWTTPVLRWAKAQGGVTGYPHSALTTNIRNSTALTFGRYDTNHDGVLSQFELAHRDKFMLTPEPFQKVDTSNDGQLDEKEWTASLERTIDKLPNLAVPDMNGGGAMEIAVSAAEGVCDFISAMDTARIPEWNTWYHLMNAGMPIKVSGETDFPCMSSRRVGQGRVYVRLDNKDSLDFETWIKALAAGRSYVSDGYAHALSFDVNGAQSGEDLKLGQPSPVTIRTKVIFAEETPLGVAHGTESAPEGLRMTGDTVNLHRDRNEGFIIRSQRTIELIVNGQVVEQRMIAADGRPKDMIWKYQIERSSWIAIRQLPQLHTNPVRVIVEGKPIRASRNSALWCAESIQNLIANRMKYISKDEAEEALSTFHKAIRTYEMIAAECPEGS